MGACHKSAGEIFILVVVIPIRCIREVVVSIGGKGYIQMVRRVFACNGGLIAIDIYAVDRSLRTAFVKGELNLVLSTIKIIVL